MMVPARSTRSTRVCWAARPPRCACAGNPRRKPTAARRLTRPRKERLRSITVNRPTWGRPSSTKISYAPPPGKPGAGHQRLRQRRSVSGVDPEAEAAINCEFLEHRRRPAELLKLTPRKKRFGRRAWPALALAQDTQLKFDTKNVDDGTVGLPYKSRIQMIGGTPPYKWQLGSGSSLPPGLTLKKLKGKIVGIPTTLGTFTFTVRVTDSAGAAANRDFTITIGDTTEVVELVSVSTTGTVGNSDSGGAAVSPDGRFVAFTSFANNLIVGDKNASADIFLRDRTCGTTIVVSVSTAGIQAKSQSLAPWISAVVGSTVFVAYASDAANLAPDDPNSLRDIFVTALDVSACPPVVIDTARVSVGLDSAGDPIQSKGLSNLPVITPDGRFVAYHSQGAGLVEGDGNGAFDIFLTEIQFSGGV